MSKKGDTNASATAYGWVFQVGAGITLMLDHIKEARALKMEGALDDIEILLDKGKLYAQAKSVTQIGNQKTATSNLKKSLETLKKDSKQGDSVQLVYISNIANPLSSQISSAYTFGKSYDFSVLDDKDKEKIKKIVGDDFPLEQLKIHIINFFGEKDEKFSSVKDKISEFLRDAINDVSYSKGLLDKWFETFMVNCTEKPDEDKKVDLSKKDIIMPLIVLVTENSIEEHEFEKVSSYDCFDELLQTYRTVINSSSYNYELCMQITGAFLIGREKALDKKAYKYEFVIDNWKDYEQEFSMIKDDEEREALVKLILLTIINKRSKLQQIKGAANL